MNYETDYTYEVVTSFTLPKHLNRTTKEIPVGARFKVWVSYVAFDKKGKKVPMVRVFWCAAPGDTLRDFDLHKTRWNKWLKNMKEIP